MAVGEVGKPRHPNAGRKKGTPNKATVDARETIARMGFNPVEAMVHWAMGNWQALGYKTATKEISIGEGKTLEVDRIDEQLRQKATKDLLPYVCPQLKSVDFSGEGVKDALALSFTALMAEASKHADEKPGDSAAE